MHIQRKDVGNVERRILRMELPGKGRERLEFIDVMRKDMQVGGWSNKMMQRTG